MKRKRGKKGKSKKVPKVEAEPNVNNLSLSGEDESSPDHKETNSRMDIDTPSTVTVQPEKSPPPVSLTPVIEKPVGRLVYNRVKLKIKSSKPLEQQVTSSAAHTHSDTDKSSQLIVPEKQLVSEKVEDSANSAPESNVLASVTQPKKAGCIKIKSSKGFGSTLSPCSSGGVTQAEKTHPKEPEPVYRHPQAERTHPHEPEPVSRHPQADRPHPKEPELFSQHPQAERPHPKEPETVSRYLQADRPHQKEPELVSRHLQADRPHQKEPELVSRHPQAERTHQKEPEPVYGHPQAERTHAKEHVPVYLHPQVEKPHPKEPETVSRHPQAERTYPTEPEPVSRESVYNKQELIASLEVIKKIMKMEASEPFNVPVNPVALGIPDYFDVIKTPMDFGTICSNLESGVKYMNSEDVYKDVQYIWENCYKYNSKGDYIMELMKRVKKNFSKYWSAAGLYSEQGDMKDGNISSHGKSSSKSGILKIKARKRHGVKRHKDDCMCAICIMVRRRQEREHLMNPADDQTETSDGLVQEVKLEGTSAMGTPNGDDTSSSTDNSQNEDADVEMVDKGGEVKLEKEVQSILQSKHQEEKQNVTPPDTCKENAVVEHFQADGQSWNGKDRIRDIQMADAGNANKFDFNNEEKTIQRKVETAVVKYQKPKEMMDAGAKAKLYKNLHQRYDNPMVLELCASLFPQNSKSLWSRHHSLVNRHSSSGNSSIDAAIATFIKY